VARRYTPCRDLRRCVFHEPPFHDAVPCTLGFEFSGLPLVGRCDPSFDVINDWDSPDVVWFRFIRGRLFEDFKLRLAGDELGVAMDVYFADPHSLS